VSMMWRAISSNISAVRSTSAESYVRSTSAEKADRAVQFAAAEAKNNLRIAAVEEEDANKAAQDAAEAAAKAAEAVQIAAEEDSK